MPTDTEQNPPLEMSESTIRELEKTPEKLAKAATKQLTVAQEAFAEPERIERLTKMIEKDREELLHKCDPEDRKQIAELASLNAQLLVLPMRAEKAKERIIAEGTKLGAFGAALHRVISRLAEEEQAAYLAVISERLKPYAPQMPDELEPHRRFPFRAIAERCPIFEHIRQRAIGSLPYFLSIVEGPSELINAPLNAMPKVIELVTNRILVLEEYYANRKTFVTGRFKDAPKH